MTTTENAINLLKEMAGIQEPYELFEPYLWKDKIGDSLWHCEIRSCDAVLGRGEAETMEEAIDRCNTDFLKNE